MIRPAVNFLLVSLFSFVLLACGETKTTEEYIAYAQSFKEQGDLDAAVVELKNALRQAPDNAGARCLIGSIYLESADGESAEKELRRCIELGVDSNTVVVSLLQAQMLQGKLQEIVDQEIELDSLSDEDQLKVWLLRGHAHLGLDDPTAAQEMYKQALALREGEPEASLGMAQVAAYNGQLGTANERAKAILEVNPDFAPAWSFLGNIEQYVGRIEEAEAAYTLALAIRGDDVSDLSNRALMRLFLGDLKGAQKDLQSARRGNALQRVKEPMVLYVQGQISLQQNQFEPAAAAFERMLKTTPNYLAARYYLAVAQYRQGQVEQAEQSIGMFRGQAPQVAAGHRLYAAIKFSQGDYGVARKELENLISFQPDDAWSLALLADISVLEGDPAQSVENYRKIVALHPESENAHLRLALSMMVGGEPGARDVLSDAAATGDGSGITRQLIIVSFMKSSEWDAAIEAAQKLVADEPENWDALTLLGGAWMGKGNADEAYPLFKKALKLKPGNPNAANNLALLELKLGKVDKARALYEEVLAHHPDDASAIMSLSSLDIQEGKISEAVPRLEQGVEKFPNNLPMKLSLARLYLRTGQPSRNLTMNFDGVGDPLRDPRILEIMGDSQIALGQYDVALGSFERLVDLAPQDATAHYRLARAYLTNNKIDRAEQELEKVIELQADHFGASVMSVRVLRKQNKLAAAIKQLERIDPAYSDRPEVLVEQGWLSLHQGDYAKAIEVFQKAFDKVPSSILAVQLGIAHWNSGDKKSAITGYTEWLEKNPEDGQVRFHLANSYMQSGQKKEAVATYRKMLEQKPNDAALINNIAWLLREDDPKEALTLAKRTIELAPEWASGLDTLGYLLMEKGDLSQAYRYFEQALKQTPGDPEIRYHMALLSSRMGENAEAVQILKAVLANPEVVFESRAEAEALFQSLR